MIELTLKIDEIDYDALAKLLLPALIEQLEQNSLGRIFVRSPDAARSAAMNLLSRMTQEKKDALLAKYITQNGEKAAAVLEDMAGKNGIKLKISSVSAEAH